MMINLNASVPISVFTVQRIGLKAFDHEKTSFARLTWTQEVRIEQEGELLR